ncbi:MAG: Fic family protein [Myxococcales bacterium]|nr:Fic family protein [Myxococcales bacterium]
MADADDVALFRQRLTMSWIYHDSALEGSVYTPSELQAAIDNQIVSDTSLIPVYDDIRHHQEAIELIRQLAEKKRLPLNLELLHKIYTTLEPGDVQPKGPPKYRKDIPLHRLYFHEIAPPDKIASRVRSVMLWLNSSETRRSTHMVRLVAKLQFQLLQVYPYPKHSGKVARLFSNLLLIRHGYPPCIIHSTDRQRYYDALKTSDAALAQLVAESLSAGIESAIKYFEEHTQRGVQSA